MKAFIQTVTRARAPKIDATITLTLEQRAKSRLKTILDNGEAVGLFMARGSILSDGDLIATQDNFIAQIIAKPEPLSSVYTSDVLLLARACYHLGNRHIELQITQNSLHYRRDHVLDAMIASFGLTVLAENIPFSPENGAYVSHATPTNAHHHSD